MSASNQAGLKVKTAIKAGGFTVNHSRPALAVRVKAGIKAGAAIFCKNHNARALLRA
jgi:hypothetical protein